MIPALLFSLASPVAQAGLFDVRIQGTFVSTQIQYPFGLTGPTTVDVTLTVDTDAAPVYVRPSDIAPGPNAWDTNLYGYAPAALSMDPVVVGAATLDVAAIVDNPVPIGAPGHSLWMNVPLTDGAVGRAWLEFQLPNNGAIEFMGPTCGGFCRLQSDSIGYDDFGEMDGIFIASVTERPDLIPFAVDVPYAIPGQPTLVLATGAPPGANLQFAGSTRTGAGPCPPSLGGACLGVLSPVRLGTATATARGDAWLVIDVPPSVPVGTTLYVQAIDGARGLATDVASVTVTAN